MPITSALSAVSTISAISARSVDEAPYGAFVLSAGRINPQQYSVLTYKLQIGFGGIPRTNTGNRDRHVCTLQTTVRRAQYFRWSLAKAGMHTRGLARALRSTCSVRSRLQKIQNV